MKLDVARIYAVDRRQWLLWAASALGGLTWLQSNPTVRVLDKDTMVINGWVVPRVLLEEEGS